METEPVFERGLTFEKVWASIQETDRQLKESKKELDKKFGELSNRFGDLVEHLVVANLVEKFNALGFNFIQANPDREITDRKNGLIFEIDAVLENGESAMAVEIKSKLKHEHIDEHIERMEKIRRYGELHNDKRTWYGAVATAIVSESVRAYALKKGFYVIEQSGDTVFVTAPEAKPATWQAVF
jgi:hypothetical protein